MEIVFVRHGESIGNVAKEKGTSYDASNICLTSKGVEQATQTGKYLEIFGNFDVVKNNFELVVFGIIGISLMPMVFVYIKNKFFAPKVNG